MKKEFLAIIVLLSIFFTSCNFKEEIYLKEDGSGSISFVFDGTELMAQMGEQGMNSKEQAIDTIVNFKDIIEENRDSILNLKPEEKEKLMKLESFTMHMQMDSKNGIFNFDMKSDFEDIAKVGDMLGNIEEANKLAPLGAGKSSPNAGSTPKIDVAYTYGNKLFSRTSVSMATETEKESAESALSSAKSFLEGSSYTVVYHFPKKVKSVSVKEATIGDGKKTVTHTVSYLDYMANPEILNIEVKFTK